MACNVNVTFNPGNNKYTVIIGDQEKELDREGAVKLNYLLNLSLNSTPTLFAENTKGKEDV